MASSSEMNLTRISRMSARKPLVPEDPALSNESDGPERKVQNKEEKVSRRESLRRRASHKKKNIDQVQIETTFTSIEQDTLKRESRSKRANGNFKSNYADAASPLVAYTIFDSPSFKNSLFFGFYILFWLSVGFLLLKNFVHAIFSELLVIWEAPVFVIFSTGLYKIALTDAAMYVSIYVPYFIQVACAKGWIQWRRTGRALLSAYEAAFTVFWFYVISNIVVSDQWIGRVFLVLHMFVFLMKMHSYAFYNGYLWKVLRELQFSEGYLAKLYGESFTLPKGFSPEGTKKLLQDSIAFCKFELLHQSQQLEDAQVNGVLEMTLFELCEKVVKFPSNITVKNFFDYTMFPTVLYSLVYSRTKRILWSYVFEKTCAMIGVIFLMLLVAEHTIYPKVIECNKARNTPMSVHDRLIFYLLTLVDLIPPLMMEYLFVFYLIWDTILNLIAELSKFADRDFYGPWWSCVDWSDFLRLWNKPVHRFLLRHVYYSSISAFSLPKGWAVLATFLISSIVHEVVMYVVFERWRGFLFLFQMSQIPLAMMSQSKFMRDKKVLGNVICWFGFVTGPAIICTLYLVY